jgi:N utilization substance protein B
MAIPQQKFREIVFQMLYSFDMGLTSEEDLCSMMMKELAVNRTVVKEALEKAKIVQKHLPEIDALISETSVSYDLNRIHSVERNVLRLGIYELYYDNALPPKVAIAESIRLSKKFGTPESVSYVNAIIDNIYKRKQSSEK